MECDLCGMNEAKHRLKLEGTMMNVCSSCAKHGQVLEEKNIPKAKPRGYATPRNSHLTVRPDFARVIKKKREEMGIKQEHLARMLKEKASVIQQIENASMLPNIALARTIERKLGISLIHEIEELKTTTKKEKKSSGMTIGDMLKKE